MQLTVSCPLLYSNSSNAMRLSFAVFEISALSFNLLGGHVEEVFA